MKIELIHGRIRDLSARVVTAKEPEFQSLLLELQAALREHARIVRSMLKESLSHWPKNTSSTKAAD